MAAPSTTSPSIWTDPLGWAQDTIENGPRRVAEESAEAVSRADLKQVTPEKWSAVTKAGIGTNDVRRAKKSLSASLRRWAGPSEAEIERYKAKIFECHRQSPGATLLARAPH